MALNLAPLAAMRAKLLDAVADEATDSILSPAVGRIPKETSTAADSGRIVIDGTTVYVTFGKSDDSNPKTGQPSNSYIEVLEEDSAARHTNGQAHFLRTSADEATAGFAERVARRVKV